MDEPFSGVNPSPSPNFPRVLVLAPVRFSQETGSGVTMSTLFRGWPQEALAQVHADRFSGLDESVCRRYVHLPYDPVRAGAPLRSLAAFSGQAARFLLGRRESLAGYWLHLERLLAWSRAFAPDLIYARPTQRPSFFVWLPRALSRALSIPYVAHIFDDWPASQALEPFLPRRLHWQFFLRRDLQALFAGSAANLAISAEMSLAFGARYGRPFETVHNGIETSEWLPVQKDYAWRGEFCLAYLGTVTPDKELASLVELRQAVLELRARGYPLRLVIYGPEIYRQAVERHLASPPAVVHGGFFPARDKPAVLGRADLLVLAFNFDAPSQVYAGLSFQTRLPETMASGTPVLVYGPPGNPNVDYAARAGWGAVVDRPDRAELAATIVRLMQDGELRARLGRWARALAFQDHDAEAIRARFRRILFAAVGRGQR
jgi:glycosyltransferase involved in cell wall biosynthesis